MNNLTWAKLLIDTLKQAKVTHFCLAPGSRSSPIAMAAAESNLELFVHFDERALGFFALGVAKTCRTPVAILVTSGTAVGNLLPSVMEAFHDEVPLIILSADRPPELHNCGANQTTDQIKIFANFVVSHLDLPCGEAFLSDYLISSVSYVVATAREKRGPIQINCMLRDPLCNGQIEDRLVRSCHYQEGKLQISDQSLEQISTILSETDEGIILCGQDAPMEAAILAKRLAWPLFVDVTSSLRGRCPHEIRYYELLIKKKFPGLPKVVLQFGRRITSKFVLEFCKNNPPLHYIQVDDSRTRFDPHHLVTLKIHADPKQIAQSLWEGIPPKPARSWMRIWEEASTQIGQEIENALEESYSEAGLARLLAQHTKMDLFFANSMPIRDAENFFFPQTCHRKIFVNRGLSGIDGNLATCAGIVSATKAPLIAVIGDMTFLHDLTSLSFFSELRLPILLFIINNKGCGIFSFLPYLSSFPYFEKIQACAHTHHFAKAAEFFNLPYYAPTTYEDLATCLDDFGQDPKTMIVEIQTNREENLLHHRQLETLVYDCLQRQLQN